jgi:Lar family restriction alleviation protein
MRLKTCPFCGGDAMLSSYPQELNNGGILQTFAVECSECGARTSLSVSKRSCIEAWERRVTE